MFVQDIMVLYYPLRFRSTASISLLDYTAHTLLVCAWCARAAMCAA